MVNAWNYHDRAWFCPKYELGSESQTPNNPFAAPYPKSKLTKMKEKGFAQHLPKYKTCDTNLQTWNSKINYRYSLTSLPKNTNFSSAFSFLLKEKTPNFYLTYVWSEFFFWTARTHTIATWSSLPRKGGSCCPLSSHLMCQTTWSALPVLLTLLFQSPSLPNNHIGINMLSLTSTNRQEINSFLHYSASYTRTSKS